MIRGRARQARTRSLVLFRLLSLLHAARRCVAAISAANTPAMRVSVVFEPPVTTCPCSSDTDVVATLPCRDVADVIMRDWRTAAGAQALARTVVCTIAFTG